MTESDALLDALPDAPTDAPPEAEPASRDLSLGNMLKMAVPLAMAVFAWYTVRPRAATMLCYQDYDGSDVQVCRHQCTHGYFSLPWMSECRPWLQCSDIESDDFVIGSVLGNGAVKLVRLAQWKGYDVVYSSPLDTTFIDDFRHGQNMLTSLQPSVHVTQLLGQCKDSFVTEYHKLGTAANIHQVLSRNTFKPYDTLKTRFGLCLHYSAVLAYLHNSPLGTRVMCDSNDLQKTLDQFLLTPDLSIIVNDLDALPLVNHSSGVGVKCGHRQLYGEFVAPEQLWPCDDRAFNDTELPLYDEKTDVWKIPDVCNFFIGNVSGSDVLRLHLFKIHAECKKVKATERPTSHAVFEQYRDVALQLELI